MTFDPDDFYDGPDTDLLTAAAPASPPAPAQAITMVTTARRIAPAAYLLLPDDQWTPADLRDYVLAQITERFGAPSDRDPAIEMSIFKGFAKRFGSAAPAIARYAFVICDGWWRSAPVDMRRFCKGCDDFFARPIAAVLDAP